MAAGQGWYRIPEETRQGIITDYQAGTNICVLSEKYRVTWLAARRILEKAGIPIRDRKGAKKRGSKLTDELRTQIISEYSGGLSSTDLKAKHGLSQTYISKIIREAGLTRPDWENKRKYECDETVFDAVTEESAYWAGFLITDGAIVESAGHSPAIVVGLGRKDAMHVEKFKGFLKAGQCVMDVMAAGPNGPHPATRFSVRSQKLADALAKFGITPNKVKRTKVIGLENDRHFWRGCIDGDGYFDVTFTSMHGLRGQLVLVGYKDLMEQFVQYAQKVVGATSSVRPQAGIFRVAVGGRKALKLIAHLYQDCHVALDRKLSIAKEISRLIAMDCWRAPLHSSPLASDDTIMENAEENSLI